MERQSSRGEYRVGPGASSLLLIFVAVCLTTVGILTLISALADSRMSDRSMAHTTAYYEAAARAQREIGVLDGQLKGARDAARGDLFAYQNAVKGLAGDQIAMKVEPDGDEAMQITFYVPMETDNHLEVALRVPLELSGPRYALVRQIAVNTADWKPDETMDMFGEMGVYDDDDASANEVVVQAPAIGDGETIQTPEGE